MSKVKWSELAARTDLTGGTLEAEEGHRYRGQIEAVRFEDGRFVITTKPGTFTMFDRNRGKWISETPSEIYQGYSVTIDFASEPRLGPGGRVEYYIPYIGHVWLYPTGMTPPQRPSSYNDRF